MQVENVAFFAFRLKLPILLAQRSSIVFVRIARSYVCVAGEAAGALCLLFFLFACP
jgi:hypothetical protein